MEIIKYKKKILYVVAASAVVAGAVFCFSDYHLSGESWLYNNPMYRTYSSYKTNAYVRNQISHFKEIHPEYMYVGERGVIYPGTERVMDIEFFMGTYTPYNPEDITYARYSSDAFEMSFTYPETWVLNNQQGKQLTISVGGYTGGSAIIGLLMASHFTIERSNAEEREEEDLRDEQYYINEIKERNGTHESVTVGGLSADKYLYSMDGYSDQVAYLIKKGEYLYIIEYETQINLTPEFDKILASLKFEEK